MRYQKQNAKLSSRPHVLRCVLIGDSITEGWRKADPDFFASNHYVNRGIGGETSYQILLRFAADVIALQPATVVILAGTNDIAGNAGVMTIEQTMRNIKAMAYLSVENNIVPVLCSVLPATDFPWRAGLKPKQQIIRLNQMVKHLAEENHWAYADYHSAMIDAAGGLDKRYSVDGVHPNGYGYGLMRPILEKEISKTQR